MKKNKNFFHIYIISQNPVHCKDFYYVFLCFFVSDVLTNAEKYVIVIRGVRVLYILDSL